MTKTVTDYALRARLDLPYEQAVGRSLNEYLMETCGRQDWK